MAKFSFIFVLTLALTIQSFAGVIHESKTKVTFKGLGEYTTHETIYVQGLKQYKESNGDFKGQGMVGQMIGGMMFGAKTNHEITDLEAMKIFVLFPEKKQYRVQPIEKIQFNSEEESVEPEENEEESEENDNIKITRQVFKVVPTGKKKTIHNFPCQEYQLFWITEWLNTETGEKGKDSLFTDVWATKATGKIDKGLQEELSFQQAYLQKVGMDADAETQSILGLNWIKMFRTMHKQSNSSVEITDQNWIKEMKKIEGYPVLIDGKFYVSITGTKKMEEKKNNNEVDFNNLTGMFGNMMKKNIKKNAKMKPKKNEPAFAYHTELIQIQTKQLSNDRFMVPAGFQLIE